MEFKLSTILVNYILYLEKKKEILHTLTRKESQILETQELPEDITSNGRSYLYRIMNDIFDNSQLMEIFDYEEFEKNTILKNITVQMNDKVFEEFIDSLVEKNEEAFNKQEVQESMSIEDWLTESEKEQILNDILNGGYLDEEDVDKVNDLINLFDSWNRQSLIDQLVSEDKNGVWTDKDNIAEFGKPATKKELIYNLANIIVSNENMDSWLPKKFDFSQIFSEDELERINHIIKNTPITVDNDWLNVYLMDIDKVTEEELDDKEYLLDRIATHLENYVDYNVFHSRFKNTDPSDVELTQNQLDDSEVDYDAMGADEILDNYDNFKGWAEGWSEDFDGKIDFNNLTESKYTKLYEAICDINQGVTVVDVYEIIQSIQSK